MNITYDIIHGNAFDELRKLPSDYVDCCITSPPYWALRDYKSAPQIWDAVNGCAHEFIQRVYKMHNGRGDAQKSAKFSEQEAIPDMQIQDAFCSKCNAWKGELGLEPTFELYINHLIQIFDEVKRVLKKTGTCFVVMGDTYSTKMKGDNRTPEQVANGSRKGYFPNGINNEYFKANSRPPIRYDTQVPEKSLCKIPQRFEIAMIDRGWIERSDIIWYKPNCMPSSAKDRFTVDYEHVFFFVKSPRYYFETQYEPMDSKLHAPGNKKTMDKFDSHLSRDLEYMQKHPDRLWGNPLGRLKRCVWKIPTAPYKEAHFATFPPALVEPMIKAGCPVNGLVLDCFAGSGTVGLVTAQNARNFIGIEINADYVQMMKKRLEPWITQNRLST